MPDKHLLPGGMVVLDATAGNKNKARLRGLCPVKKTLCRRLCGQCVNVALQIRVADMLDQFLNFA